MPPSSADDPELYESFDPGLAFRDATGREEVPLEALKAAPRLEVILGFGQSNIANECDPAGLHAACRAVYNFDFLSGRCYRARDPLLGASLDRSNVLTRLGDLLVARGSSDAVLLVPIAYGGSHVAEWAPGGAHFPRLALALRRLAGADLRITRLLWQQGEADAADPRPDLEGYGRAFGAMVGAIRERGVEAPIHVAQCTVCRCEPFEPLRRVQRSLVDPARGILAGADTDRVEIDERWDGCHFSTAGLRKAAELWLEAIMRPAGEPAQDAPA